VEHVLNQLRCGEPSCADAMAAVCRDRAEEITAIPAPLAAALAKRGVETATRVCGTGDATAQFDALSTLRRLLACPSLRDAAVKASRLKSLATYAMEVVVKEFGDTAADAAASAVLGLLQEAGVDVTTTGAIDETFSPLSAALRHRLLGAAKTVFAAGADVNMFSGGGQVWPLVAAVFACFDEGTAWLLEHGASLKALSSVGNTIVHFVAMQGAGPALDRTSEFGARWVRHFITAEPSLLETRDKLQRTPLMLAAGAGFEACVAVLVELGADVGAVGADGKTALTEACASASLPIVRRLIAAGAASAAALPPGSLQARNVGTATELAAVKAERGCLICAARCGGQRLGNCADGLDILRAVLAAGVREAVGYDGLSLASVGLRWMRHKDDARRISEGHALTVLQALHAGGVDVLARGPADELPILHAAAVANAPTLVRWLVTEAGAPLEERDNSSFTPLVRACFAQAWAAAHALVVCGARVDVQSGDGEGMWPVLAVMNAPDCEPALQRAILAADRDSLLRRSSNGVTAMHGAALNVNPDALQMLLSSGLPHLSDAVDDAAEVDPEHTIPHMSVTPLHCACGHAHWDAALALLAAGAHVDIAGYIDCRLQTIAEWARRSPACKHRGVKRAIAARAREDAAETESFVLAAWKTACASAAVADGAAVTSVENSIGASPAHAGAGAAGTGTSAAVAVASGSTGGKGKQAKSRKGRQGVARNRAEEADEDAAAVGSTTPHAAATAATSAPEAAATPAAPNACEELSAIAIACCLPSTDVAEALASAASALNVCEDPSISPALASTATATVPQPPAHAASAVEPALSGDEREGACGGLYDATNAAGTNTCEPGTEAAAVSTNTCEPGAAADASSNACEPGAASEGSSNTCEPGEGATSAAAAASIAATAAALLADLHSALTSAATMRRHLAALSELARDPAAAAALCAQGAMAATAAAVSRHGVSVAVAASALLALLGAGAAEGSEEA